MEISLSIQSALHLPNASASSRVTSFTLALFIFLLIKFSPAGGEGSMFFKDSFMLILNPSGYLFIVVISIVLKMGLEMKNSVLWNRG